MLARSFVFAWISLASTIAYGQTRLNGPLVTIGRPDANVAITSIPSIDKWVTSDGAINPASVVRFGNPQLIRDDGVVVFEDGSHIVAKELRTEGTQLHAYNRLWDEMKFPLRPLRGILLRSYLDPDKTQVSLDRIHAYQGTRDRLLLANGDYIDGTLRRLTPLSVEFQIGDKALKLDRKRIAEIHFARSAGILPTAEQGVWVGLNDGSMILASELSLSDDILQVRLSPGISMRSSTLENAFAYVTYLRPVASDVQYLSDLDAIGFKSLGFLNANWDYRKDRNVQGGTLKSSGYVSQKGLGLHATSRLAYKVENKAVRLRAKVGIDDDTDGAGSVIFKVFASETGKSWETIYESPIVRGGETPLDVDVSVQGMKGLALVVEYADGADVLDHANWMDARFEME
ncbi:NPCBM/NEW2 domain-containing protein [Bremerella volcania]|uniref:NPCBM/NEW2 domain-containing protein n=1 Tax=Bremerella volcania TaxID=2527984 RepID=UPI0011A8C0CD|nr:NPCBM/NEW2 domain-containing protein [Bremerella volcania]